MSGAESSARQSPLQEIAVGLLFGVVGAGVAAIPGALRSGVAFAGAWLALWGSAALLMAPAAAALRVARPLAPLTLAVPAGLVFAAAPLIVFARVLKTATHHRPLGAATFAVIAALVALGAIAIAARWIVAARDKSVVRSALYGALALCGALTAVLALPLVSVAAGSVLDAVLAVVLAAAAAWLPGGRAGRARIAGPVLLVLAVGAGFAARSDDVRRATASHAPVLAGPWR